jgi:hypothetical protein
MIPVIPVDDEAVAKRLKTSRWLLKEVHSNKLFKCNINGEKQLAFYSSTLFKDLLVKCNVSEAKMPMAIALVITAFFGPLTPACFKALIPSASTIVRAMDRTSEAITAYDSSAYAAIPDINRVEPLVKAVCMAYDQSDKADHHYQGVGMFNLLDDGSVRKTMLTPIEALSKTVSGSAQKTIESLMDDLGGADGVALFDSVISDGCSTAVNEGKLYLSHFQQCRKECSAKFGIGSLNAVSKS